ncbi:hypothetical protein B0T11DRAFT_4212 [Plectosphaerella cucumerina]|jgi:hypothetical protein|uniref:Apolipoprotein/apolipophorin n=1 Tax=Plectosphaerella cucumerina TaxID=40658 RepID=A0A8K0X8T9_9PEZI|nr:hypothetical protein B0T11DRAFT_4212 [Plectosphaerella cucumerina]
MLAARPAVRTALPRAARAARVPRRQARFQSTTSSASPAAAGGGSGFAAGIAGGVLGAALCYGAFTFTPTGRAVSTVNKTVKEAEQKYQAAASKLQEKTPSADEAAGYIKQLLYSYVAWVPGGRAYVDAAFNDWEKIRENHKDEADKIVNDAYKHFQEVAKAGFSMDAASRAYEAVADLSKKLADLTTDAAADLLDNHPQAKEKLGGSVDQLKQMGDKYGPEAKKQVDETWKQLKDLASGGFNAENLDKARKIIEEKVEQVRKLGDEAWKRGLEEAKPLLDKNPKVKELVENNADALRQGNAAELFEKAKKAIESGDLGGLEGYVNDAVDKAKSAAGGAAGFAGLDKYFKMIPNGDEILPKLKALGEVADKHKDEGEKLLKETLEEVKKVLEEKSSKAQDIIDKAKKDAKKETK